MIDKTREIGWFDTDRDGGLTPISEKVTDAINSSIETNSVIHTTLTDLEAAVLVALCTDYTWMSLEHGVRQLEVWGKSTEEGKSWRVIAKIESGP